MMTKKYCSLLTCVHLMVALIILTAPTINSAHAATDHVTIIPTILSRCGNQQTYVTGTASYAQVVNRDLVVKLDGVVVYQPPRYVRPTTWTTALFNITTGAHVITATIYRDGAHTIAVASETWHTTVDSCRSESTSNGGSGHSEPTIPTKVQKVMNNVAGIFKSVFGDKINSAESTYWKNRAIGKGEKYTVKELKKEMLAYKKSGLTMPKVVKVTAKGLKFVTAGKESAVNSFKPYVKNSNIVAGNTINFTWSTSKENRAKFANERIYICTTSATPKCTAVVASTPNDGKQNIKVSAAPGTYRFAIQALNNDGNPIEGIRATSNAFKVLAN